MRTTKEPPFLQGGKIRWGRAFFEIRLTMWAQGGKSSDMYKRSVPAPRE